MFERIVAAIDNDTARADLVLQATKELAEAFHSAVLVAHVRELERVSAMVAAAGKPGLPPAIHVESEEQCRELVDSAVDQLTAAGINARGEVGPGAGSTARDLLAIADDFRANLIVAGDRDSRMTDVVLGGVSHRIVHLARCPVLLVR